MTITQQKTPTIAGRGHLRNLVRAIGKPGKAPVALLVTQNSTFGVTSNEFERSK